MWRFVVEEQKKGRTRKRLKIFIYRLMKIVCPVKGIKGILSKGNRNMAKSSRQVIFDRIVLFMDMAYEGKGKSM